MAFHVACPITCRRICYCGQGFPQKLQNEKGKNEFLDAVARLEEFLMDPWLLRIGGSGTVQVAVPKVVVAPPQPAPVGDGVGSGGEEALVSAQTKLAALRRKAAVASVVAEDYARRFESGHLEGAVKDLAGEEQVQSNVKIMCRLCFSGENEGSERARKMFSCKSCGKKYHRSCLKAWAQHRDLFHWSSWTCPSCRICEVCRRTGDPSKFMFCRRCDAAYHCYCQQPPHKNVSSGPYLCPKHTRCHSCGSTVPGNGLSVRWFLGYTCCDACGRLFVKGNYCPVCLKVYRDSESTPMVCCDMCQRWVHCHCDGISDEKYMQFQMDENLQYACATCRGECYQVRDPEDAVQELWRRRDIADLDLIANLRAAAGLPTQEEIFSISPYSDDEENDPVLLKHDYGRSLKFSVKGLVDKSPRKGKENGEKSSNKKSGKKKGYQTSYLGETESCQSGGAHGDSQIPQIFKYSSNDNRNSNMQFYRSDVPDSLLSPAAGSLTEGFCAVNQAGVLKQKFIDEVTTSNENRTSKTVQTKRNKILDLNTGLGSGKHANNFKTNKGPKLVIHLGARNKIPATSSGSDVSSCQRDQDITTPNGHKMDCSDQVKGSKFRVNEGSLINIKKFNSELSDRKLRFGGMRVSDGYGSVSTMNTQVGRNTGWEPAVGTVTEVPTIKGEKSTSLKYVEGMLDVSGDLYNDSCAASVSHSLPKYSKPLLKLKFKKPYHDDQSSWPQGEEERGIVKGQRSKRTRSFSFMEKPSTRDDEDALQWYEGNTMEEIMDANWILQKLGKDAIGKRVEVHQSSNNSWHRGTVMEVFEGTSSVSVVLDDGRDKNLELGRQGIRFVSQKQKQ